MQIVIIDYGAGNVFSVRQAFKRLGLETVLSSDPEVIQTADRVIFPGVGHALPAMEALRKSELDRCIPALKQPVLGICLGMQLLCESTAEGDVKGLGVFQVQVNPFGENLIVPHMGWNEVIHADNRSEAYYFVHGYKAAIGAQTIGRCDYGEPFSAMLQELNFLGVQFHPEKSGLAGEALLKAFLKGDFVNYREQLKVST